MTLKIDVVKLAKIAGMILTVAGTVVTGWVGTKENEKTLEKLVEDHFKEE